LIVCRRRHKAALSKALSDLEAQRMISSVSALKQAPRGGIFCFQQPEYDVSSTAIRRKLQLDQSLQDDLDPKVYQFIREQRLYLKQDESMSI
jgi:nicotinic acid mononucleotide adenylyltransferase